MGQRPACVTTEKQGPEGNMLLAKDLMQVLCLIYLAGRILSILLLQTNLKLALLICNFTSEKRTPYYLLLLLLYLTREKDTSYNTVTDTGQASVLCVFIMKSFLSEKTTDRVET